jgi:hypothetical protein
VGRVSQRQTLVEHTAAGEHQAGAPGFPVFGSTATAPEMTTPGAGQEKSRTQHRSKEM